MLKTGIPLFCVVFVASTLVWSDEPARPECSDKQQQFPANVFRDGARLPNFQGSALKVPTPPILEELQKLVKRLKTSDDKEAVELLERCIVELKKGRTENLEAATSTCPHHTVYLELFEVDFDKIAADSNLRNNDSNASSQEIYTEIHRLMHAERNYQVKPRSIRRLANHALLQEGFNLPTRLSDGGEFPVPVPGNDGAQTVEFREFGQMMETKLTPLQKNRVQLQLTCEVSERDAKNAVTVNGMTIPGINKRRIQSATDMNLDEWTLCCKGSSTKGRQLFLMAKVSLCN